LVCVCAELYLCTGLGMHSVSMCVLDLIVSRLDFHTGLAVCT